ncbi:MAG TPA: ATP-dependent Clp protease proteolytic subunit [Lacunisphaera sp.]|jgi:ATP-dependent Clp protease protease subunit|nr:ATP-dependent Clp protease proteolytic subunit [Lacunisphaera sp.]
MTTTVQPNEVYATFVGAIDQNTIAKIMQAISFASQNKVTHFHLLFQSGGGSVNDGICLYNFLKACPLPLSIYNVGAVQSIALVAYLGAKTRIASKSATFMIHRTTGPAIAVGTNRLQSISKAVALDDLRTEAIIKQYSQVAADEWTKLTDHEFWLTAEDAVKSGLATAIGEFSPPTGAPIYNL